MKNPPQHISGQPVFVPEVRKRLDQYVLERFPALSRSYASRLVTDGKVLVNGEVSKPGYKLRGHDKVVIDFDVATLEQIPDIDLPVLYEDNNVVVINKPAGVISHSRGRYWNEPSVASFIRQLTGQNGDRPGIVHRLDRATSGVMICARNQAALSWLQKQFADRKTKKTYAAIIAGKLNPPEAIIDMAIERNPKAPATFRIGPNGKPAQTTYKMLATSNHYALVELTPLTGRTHQLRVHLKQVGHPIVGDILYGGTTANRLMLHARRLEITLPNKKKMAFEAPLPAEFKTYVP